MDDFLDGLFESQELASLLGAAPKDRIASPEAATGTTRTAPAPRTSAAATPVPMAAHGSMATSAFLASVRWQGPTAEGPPATVITLAPGTTGEPRDRVATVRAPVDVVMATAVASVAAGSFLTAVPWRGASRPAGAVAMAVEAPPRSANPAPTAGVAGNDAIDW